jgi:2-oxoisovalerate dehydrogenase E1 component alpha subunit
MQRTEHQVSLLSRRAYDSLVGQAIGPWTPELSSEVLLAGLRHMMLLLRAYDARMMVAQRQGKTSFYMQHLGEEAISCAFQCRAI